MNTQMTNVHRYFNQFMLTNGLVSQDNAMSFFEEISPEEENSLTHLKNLIIEINRKINDQCFKIVWSTCEVTGEKVLIWLNTKNDELSRHQIGFSALELEYFHAIMQEIISSEDHRILYPRSINISSTLTATFSRENGEKALTKWIRGGYFVKRNEFVYLGPRTILEFTTYLRTHTENCTCNLCSELVFVGDMCASCNKTYHSYCIERYLQSQHNCPSCKNDWESAETTTNNMDADDSEEAGPSYR